MENKECFNKAIRRFQNYYSHKITKNKLLEKAFGEETAVFDFDGVDELFFTIEDMACLMFPNLSKNEIDENLEWYLYEAVDMNKPFVEEGENKWFINSPEDLYDMLDHFNQLSTEKK